MVIGRRIPQQLVWVILGAIVVGLWVLVARQLSNPAPVARSKIAPTGLVWSGRVFTTRRELDGWLHAHGSSYAGWAHAHPDASVIFKPARRTATPSKPTKASSSRPAKASSSRPAKASSRTGHAVLAKTASAAPRSEATGPTVMHTIGIIALLLLAAAAIVAGLAPAEQLRRLRLTRALPLEIRVAAVGAGVTISIVVAAVSVMG